MSDQSDRREERLKELLSSENEKDRQDAILILSEALKTEPDNVGWRLAKAKCHDFLGDEDQAEPEYRQVYTAGWKKLPFQEQSRFFVGFGSTLRNLGRIDESIAILKEGVASFPEFPALRLFLSLSFYSSGDHKTAAKTALLSMADVSAIGLAGYERALRFYAENLD